MPNASALYPPGPREVPAGFTAPTSTYKRQVVIVLLSILGFVLLYLVLVAVTGWLVYLSFTYPMQRVDKGNIFLKIVAVVISSLLFLFLLKGLFKRQQKDDSTYVEVTEEDQPLLFDFLRRLCKDTGAPFPYHVYVSPEVNACVFYNSSFFSLFLPSRKNLLVGLGLVNVLNLSELKAVLAHEFGHFSQSSMKLGSYVYVSNHILTDMVYGRDWLDNLVIQARNSDVRIAVVAWAFTGIVWVLRKGLELLFRGINLVNLALSRQMEFNADLVAVSVSGSDAIVHGLSRLEFAGESLGQAIQDLVVAADHKLFSSDLFYHQRHAMSLLRRREKKPTLGEPPPLPDDPDEVPIVFDPNDHGVPAMWASHPSNYDREQNAKKHYLRTQIDDRSAWELFENADALKEKVTRKAYVKGIGLESVAQLEDPKVVQSFIDDEHAETTYLERYHGIYDDRFLQVEKLSDWMSTARTEDDCEEHLAEDPEAIFSDGLAEFMAGYKSRRGEAYLLQGLQMGQLELTGKTFDFRGRQVTKKELEACIVELEKDLEKDNAWFEKFDRRVFLSHWHQARRHGDDTLTDLEVRYRFHATVQKMLEQLNSRVESCTALLNFLSQKEEWSEADVHECMSKFKVAYLTMDNILERAAKVKIPPLKNFQTGESLEKFLADKGLVLPLDWDGTSIDGAWIGSFMTQAHSMREKIRRLHFKSLGGILQLQEKLEKG